MKQGRKFRHQKEGDNSFLQQKLKDLLDVKNREILELTIEKEGNLDIKKGGIIVYNRKYFKKFRHKKGDFRIYNRKGRKFRPYEKREILEFTIEKKGILDIKNEGDFAEVMQKQLPKSLNSHLPYYQSLILFHY